MGKAEELAAAVAGLECGKGKRRKYPMELRQRLVDFVREQRAAGKQLKSIAARAGVTSSACWHTVSTAGGARAVASRLAAFNSIVVADATVVRLHCLLARIAPGHAGFIATGQTDLASGYTSAPARCLVP